MSESKDEHLASISKARTLEEIGDFWDAKICKLAADRIIDNNKYQRGFRNDLPAQSVLLFQRTAEACLYLQEMIMLGTFLPAN